MIKKLAIQLFGHMRTYELTYQKFRENIIEVNLRDGWEIDLFIHTWDKFNSSSKSWHENLNLFSNNNYLTKEDKNKIQRLYNPKFLSIEPLEDGVHGGLLSKIRGNELRKQYSNNNYTYILYTRPDLLFINPFRIDTFLSIYLQGAYKNIGLPKKHTFCCNNFFRGRKVADPRILNEGDLIYFSDVEQNLFRPEENKDFLNISLDYTLHKDFFIQREKFIHGWRSHPLDQYEDKIKLLQNQVKDRESEIKKIQSELKDISHKKQELEILDLECGISLKKKHIEELESNILLKRMQILERKKSENCDFKIVYKENSAISRVKNYLSYKLGQAIIANSKSLLGYIRMPFVLSYIYDKHRQEQKLYQEKIKKDTSLRLPPLESYPDYREALKEKECFTYKLGQAFIQANKTWYKGGYVKMWFEIRQLKREFLYKQGIK